ncbi:MAG TPA: sulfite exporter TauE/SafE family protein [bacterium]|nr:sulfite exporter TauE/SafE family protein [bacterium]HMW34908.1 sulfite exporter TauE/SafE family protein [bacterium]HMY36533.1 sulfite exporter TauE/SafE family protein [bacterium]HMZ05170.1 sulfite exporter TauE/SafE family protein [bacterium]HNB10212.1 sulfite exporter TauE/SafE family protein [bacterium]
MEILAYLIIGFTAGAVGSMVGLGGAIIMTPALTILLNVPIKSAIGASLIALIATSVMSTAVYSKKELIHYRYGMLLLILMVSGSFIGSAIGVMMDARLLSLFFVALMIFAAAFLLYQVFQNENPDARVEWQNDEEPHRFPPNGVLLEAHSGIRKFYRVQHGVVMMFISGIAGVISGMLGVGGGIIQVPFMHAINRMPIKAATATSGFMIGYTGMAGALVYVIFGQFELIMTSALVLGILTGSQAGARLAIRLHARWIIYLVIVVLTVAAIRLFMKVF